MQLCKAIRTRLTVSLAALSVQFAPATYSVNEGEQVMFMVVLSGPADREVTVEFATSDGSATGMLTWLLQ